MHRLLSRQVKNYLTKELLEDSNVKRFLTQVEISYTNYDIDYETIEHTFEQNLKDSFRELSYFKDALNSSAIVTISDYNGKLIFVNDKFIETTGFSKDDIIGKSHKVLNSPNHSVDFYQNIWKHISKGEIWEGEIQNIKKDGSNYWARVTIVPLKNVHGNPIKYLSIMNDISNEKQAEIEIKEYARNLEKKNKELDQFAYVVSHDLKAPLRAINNLSEWIEEDLEEVIDTDTKKNIDLLRGRVHRMENLINGILEYSRVGRQNLNSENVNTKELIDELIDTLGVDDKTKFIVPDVMPTINAERLLLEQIFSNLISNAIKYNDKEVVNIEITHKSDGQFHTFGIIDNGPGIEKEYFDTIFVIFQTLQPRDKIESTGVGLAIVKKIINEKGGNIWLESEKEKGSSFYFTWPK